MMATAALAPAGLRRISRVDGRLVLGALLVAGSVLGGLRLVAAADRSVAVVAAAHDLAAGHVLAPGDLAVTRVRATPTVLHGLIAGADVAHLDGRVLLAPLARHGLLATAAVGRAPRAGREITVPVAPDHALGGDLRVGERVDILASYGKGTDAARTVTVVRDAEIVGVRRAAGVFGQGAGDLSAVTVSVGPDDAVALAFAIRNAELDVVRSTSAAPAARDSYDLSDVDAPGPAAP